MFAQPTSHPGEHGHPPSRRHPGLHLHKPVSPSPTLGYLVLGDLQVGLVALVIRLQLQSFLKVVHGFPVLLQGTVLGVGEVEIEVELEVEVASSK